MAMLMEVSRNISAKMPNHIAASRPSSSQLVERLKLPALGSRAITITAITEPMSRYGLRRPIQPHQVLSDHLPISG